MAIFEFRGEVSGNCKKYILRQEAKIMLFGAIFASVLVGIPTIIIMICSLSDTIPWYWILAIDLTLIAFFLILAGKPASKKDQKMILPSRVIFTEDGLIISEGEKFKISCYIKNVKSVFDMGEWYHISCGNGVGPGRFVCQKNLIKVGSIEEFEAFFKNKIKTLDPNSWFL